MRRDKTPPAHYILVSLKNMIPINMIDSILTRKTAICKPRICLLAFLHDSESHDTKYSHDTK